MFKLAIYLILKYLRISIVYTYNAVGHLIYNCLSPYKEVTPWSHSLNAVFLDSSCLHLLYGLSKLCTLEKGGCHGNPRHQNSSQ